VDRILKEIQDFEKTLNRPFVAEEFYKLLKQAYRQTVKVEGERAPIIKVLQHLVFLIQPKSFWENPSKSNFRGYSRLQFAYDLYRLRKSRLGDRIVLITATFDQTKSRSTALFVPETDEKGSRYAYIVVK
jgi:hypothetical protein